MSASMIQELRAGLGERGVITDAQAMAPYLGDWRGRERGEALAVVLPADTGQVAAVIRMAAAAGLPVFPQGGNTGLCYGAVPRAPGAPGLVLGLGRMDRIREVDRHANVITVDAGVVLSRVHAAAAEVGRCFPLHLGSEGTAQIGGLISTNAGGTGALRYGPMRDLVAGLEVVLPDGCVFRDLDALRKNNIGYDLKQCFVGAEGTLGVVTGAALRMHAAIRARADAWVAVDEPAQALELLSRLQDRFDASIQAFELVSGSEIRLVLEHVPGSRCPFDSVPEWNVMIELGDADPDAPLGTRLEQTLAGALEEGGARDAVIAASLAQAESFWRVRHSVSEANSRGGYGLTHDIAVRVSRVPGFIAAADRLLAERFPQARPVVVCHLGDGNVHYIAMFERETWQRLANREALRESIQTAIHDLALAHGGSFSAEHGIGRKLTGELARLGDPVRLDLMARIRHALDPDQRMNPGVLLDPPGPGT